ncbi:energy transducer TonB [Flavobacterium wongokense]|uniref:energy transducer TonB n=1 Tax=Flavobacterium wongokense TaxID=2910674 RepID=UPI001F2DF1DB|nr:energy transducer TonB [Flavobacterium sp. WG47]MCF6132359.1 energy transducer TonB [Flavobacterium sp. WG47]
MSNVSIYEKNWTELVFEDRNKAYGAYQLRQENPKTTVIAFVSGLLLIFTLIGSWMLLSSFGDNPKTAALEDDDIIITISDFNYPKKEKPKKEEVVAPLKKEETKKKIEKEDLKNAVLVKENFDDVKTNKELKENPTTDNRTDGGNTTGTTTTTNTTGTTTTTTVMTGTKTGDDKARTTNELDRLPAYPGGIDEFYKYVGKNIDKPEVDEHLSSISVIMSFVIEKDGSMSEIKVMRSSDKNLEREAIRVLKALKVKWSPGYKDGEKVRTLYVLPIKVQL